MEETRRVAPHRPQHEEEAGAAERPGERVEAHQLERRSRRERRHLVGTEWTQQPGRDMAEHRWVEQDPTTTAKAATGISGTSAPPMITSPTTKTMTPATAEIPASSRIDASTTGVS